MIQSRLLLTLAALAPVTLPAQQIQLGDALSTPGAPHRQHVEQESSSAHVRRGHPDWIELRFQVDPGMHINSHTPKDELLIPTILEISSTPALKVTGEEYPGGIPLHLEIGSGETLSTYQGEFSIRLQVVAPASTELAGSLRYQACDAHSCFPPRTLPVKLAIEAR